jgi:hypothetical protein
MRGLRAVASTRAPHAKPRESPAALQLVQIGPAAPHDLDADAEQDERDEPRHHEHADLAAPRDQPGRVPPRPASAATGTI